MQVTYPFPSTDNLSSGVLNIEDLSHRHLKEGIRFLYNYGRKYYKEHKCKPVLVGLRPEFEEVLTIIGFDHLLKYYYIYED